MEAQQNAQRYSGFFNTKHFFITILLFLGGCGDNEIPIVKYGSYKDLSGIAVYGFELSTFFTSEKCNFELKTCSDYKSAYWIDNIESIKLPVLENPTSNRSFITMCARLTLRGQLSEKAESGYYLDNNRYGLNLDKVLSENYSWRNCRLNLGSGQLDFG